MAIPSGSGSEVLKTGSIHELSNTLTEYKLDGSYETTSGNTSNSAVPTNHIITILNIIFVNHADDADEKVSLFVYNGSTDIWLLNEQTLNRQDTFVWDEKLVLQPTWKLKSKLMTAGNVDITYSYIVQNWS
ncbi:MAG: hypothetical protein Unbinned2902contig1001_2 [Prokaryotic dsDNA virus sp.]|nr:MAG: hypothetical protein Unbinned2902contig1001_2 [Prokaryotic dsDNA virus sp.]|tara:strand:- start:651 stop:1043 length:393 start_codon:yes stop_codon:yes gene_type:complete